MCKQIISIYLSTACWQHLRGTLYFSAMHRLKIHPAASALTDNLGLKCDNQAQQNYIITATALTRHCEHTPLPCTSRVLSVLRRMRSNAICFVRGLQSDSHIEENRKSCFPQWTCSFLMLQHFEEAAFQREKIILSLITSSMASVQILWSFTSGEQVTWKCFPRYPKDFCSAFRDAFSGIHLKGQGIFSDINILLLLNYF